jgi:hypothetical protein
MRYIDHLKRHLFFFFVWQHATPAGAGRHGRAMGRSRAGATMDAAGG